MVRRHDPFRLALAQLRRDLAQGFHTPGGVIVIQDEARRLRLSPTPVREALAWLAGAGAVERSPLGGYLAPRLDAGVIRDRLAFRLVCLSQGLDASATLGLPPRPAPPQSERNAHLLFDRIVERAGNRALTEAFSREGERLAPLALAEERLIRNNDEGAAAMWRLEGKGDYAALSEAVVRHHQHRITLAPALAAELIAHPPLDSRA